VTHALRAFLACIAFGLSIATGPARADAPLEVWIDRDWPPHQFADERGRPAGFDVDLFRAVADAEGLDYRLSLAEWEEIRSALERGEIDANPGVFRTAAREKTMDFTAPTAWVHYAVFVRDDSTATKPEDLLGGSVLIIRGGVHDDFLAEHDLDVTPIRTRTHPEIIQRLSAGEGDGAIILDTQGLYFARTLGLHNVRSLGIPLENLELRFAVPADREALLARLNDGLAQVRKSGRYDQLYDQWFGVLKPQGIPAGRVLLALGGSLLALALVAAAGMLWSRSLRRQVDARTRALLETDARLRGTLAAAREVGFLVAEDPSDDARILEWSEGAERLFGWPAGRLHDLRVGALRSAGDRAAHPTLLGRAEPDGSASREAELTRRGGDAFPAFVVASLLPAGEGQPARLLYAVFDLSQRARAEEEKRALAARLHRAEKMEALGRLAGGVAHDFNNVLTTVVANVELARRSIAGGSEATECLDEVDRAAQTAADITRQLLSFARREPSKPSTLSWNGVAAELEPMLRRLLPGRVRLELRSEGRPWHFRMDPGQASQVLLNLVLNARDSFAEGGSIEISSENRSDADGDYCVLEVRDDGCGMDEETAARIFEPFFTTREELGGTGLGLATVYAAVEGVGGRIDIDTKPERGTRFRVAIPRDPSAGAGPG
jgi:PAS domain S-box-containing protein